MKRKQALGIFRHLLTFGGGLLAGQGVIDEGMALELSGALATVVGIIWSIIDKK